MQEVPASNIDLIRAGVARVRNDFNDVLVSLGFKRTKTMVWTRQIAGRVERIGMLRLSATGPALTASVRLRIDFDVQTADGEKEGPVLSDHLRDSEGRAYHLRFNASSWSTYDRCVADLSRVVTEHAIPWFAAHRP
jgi:hypothetical protein